MAVDVNKFFVRPRDFKYAKKVAKSLIDHFDFSETGAHVSIMAFSGNDTKYFSTLVNFDSPTCPDVFNNVKIKLKIDGLKQIVKSVDRTPLYLVLEKVRDDILTAIPTSRRKYETVCNECLVFVIAVLAQLHKYNLLLLLSFDRLIDL